MTTHIDKWDRSWHERSSNAGRRILRIVFTDLAIAVVIFLGLEIILTLAGYQPARPTVVGANAYGYREKDFSTEKTHNQIRILALGDSTTFGTGLPWNEAYPKQLQSLLKEKYPFQDFLVVNAGGEASSLQHAWENLEKNCRQVQPDVVIVMLAPPLIAIQNLKNATSAPIKSPLKTPITLLTASKQFNQSPEKTIKKAQPNQLKALLLRAKILPVKIHAWLHNRVKSYQFLQHEIRFNFYRLGLMKEDLKKYKGAIFAYAFDVGSDSQERLHDVEKSYQTTSMFLAKIDRSLREKNIPLYVPAIPSRFMISDLPEDNYRGVDKTRMQIDPHSHFREMCRVNEIPFVDAKTPLVSSREKMIDGKIKYDDLYIPDDYTHLNKAGNKVLAREILKRLEEDGVIDKIIESREHAAQNDSLVLITAAAQSRMGTPAEDRLPQHYPDSTR